MILPDWLNVKLSAEQRLYVLLVLLSMVMGYYLVFQLHGRRVNLSKRIEKFKQQTQSYKSLKKKDLTSTQSTQQIEEDESPLAYLERVVPQEYITKLSPNDQGRGSYSFELRMENIKSKAILQLLQKLEKNNILSVSKFSLTRTQMETKIFEVTMRLEDH